jgi:hypothetical protein
MRGRAFLAAWLVAPIPLVIFFIRILFIPPLRVPGFQEFFGLGYAYVIGLLYGAAAILSVGLLASVIFERRGIMGWGAHILVGALAATLVRQFYGFFTSGGPLFGLDALPFGALGGWTYWRVRHGG